MSRARTAYFDNARFVLLLLVVVGHVMAFTKADSRLAYDVYVWIYLFHMPAFVLITGYLSRSFTWTPASARRTVETLVVPVIVFELASQPLLRWLEGESYGINPFITQWLGWFLWAMVVWRVLTPLFQALRAPVLWAVAASLFLPFMEFPSILAVNKVIGFLPFYVLGMALTEDRFRLLARRAVRIVASAFLTVVGLVIALAPRLPDTTVLLWKRSYTDPALQTDLWEGLLVRTALLILGLAMTLAFLALCSWASRWYSQYGQRTLYAYLLHGFFVLGLAYGTTWTTDAAWYVVVGLIAGALGLAVSLMTPPIKRLFKPVLEPKLPMIFR